MKTDRATIAPQTNSEIHAREMFARMSRQAGRLAQEITPGSVHRFRTNSRRVETAIEQFSPEGIHSKLLKQLSKLRKKAGRLRDLDVQIDFLKNLKIPDRQNHRAQLLENLENEKSKRTRKLASSFDRETVGKLRHRLHKMRAEIDLQGIDPLAAAFSRLPEPGMAPKTEKDLHACRIAAKRARYLAELSDAPAAKQFVEELKRAQDAIGEWHDILKLSERAEKLFGGVRDSALVSALQNIMRARFRRANAILNDALRAISELRPQNEAARKAPTSAASSRSAAA